LAAEAKAAKDADSREKKDAQVKWKENQEKKKAPKPGNDNLEGVGEVDVEAVAEAAARRDLTDAAMGKGEGSLFEKKMSKEEKKAAAAEKKAAAAAKRTEKKTAKGAGAAAEDDAEGGEKGPKVSALAAAALAAEGAAAGVRDLEAEAENLGIVTTYASSSKKLHANTRDINVASVSVQFHGKYLIEDTDVVLNYGNRCARATHTHKKCLSVCVCVRGVCVCVCVCVGGGLCRGLWVGGSSIKGALFGMVIF
jgi:hypothetical protein